MTTPSTVRPVWHRFGAAGRARLAIALFIGLVLVHTVHAKVVSGQVALSSDVCDVYLGKFSFSPAANGRMGVVFKPEGLPPNSPLFQRGRSMSISLFRDEGWHKYRELLKSGSLCHTRMQHAFFTQRVMALKEPYDLMTMLGKVPPISSPTATPAGLLMQTLVPVQEQTRYVFAVLHDCMLENYKADPVTYNFELVFLNDGSHLPADEEGMITAHALLGAVLVGYLMYVYSLLQRQRRDFSTIHLVSLLCALSLVLQIIAVFCTLAHLIVYANDGKGLRFRHTWIALDFVSKIAQSASELIVAFVFLCLAAGWTLTDSFSMRRLASNPFAALAVMSVLGLTLAMEILGRRFEDDFNQFHAHEHWPGAVLMALRVFLALVYVATVSHVYGIIVPKKLSHWLSPCVFSSDLTFIDWLVKLNNYGTAPPATAVKVALPPGADANVAAASENRPLRPDSAAAAAAFVESETAALMNRVSAVALVWLLTFPVVGFLIAPLLPPHLRHPFTVCTSLVAQCAALCYLLNAFLNPNSRAFKASSLRNMGTVFDIGGESELGSGWMSRWLKASID